MTADDADAGVKKLLPISRTTGDRQFRFVCDCGTVLGWTKMSRKLGTKNLGANLESLMARQMGITSKLWRDIAGCKKGLDEFLKAQGHWHRA